MNSRYGGWIQTYTGVRFYPLDPRPEEVHIEDIAHSLSLQCRYAGHCPEFYSVAQHCVLASEWLLLRHAEEYLQLGALLHDASEAYLVDIPSPIKNTEEFGVYRKIEAKLEDVIAARFGLGTLKHPLIKEADETILATEFRDFMHIDGKTLKMPPAASLYVKPVTPTVAETTYLFRFRRLYAGT